MAIVLVVRPFYFRYGVFSFHSFQFYIGSVNSRKSFLSVRFISLYYRKEITRKCFKKNIVELRVNFFSNWTVHSHIPDTQSLHYLKSFKHFSYLH